MSNDFRDNIGKMAKMIAVEMTRQAIIATEQNTDPVADLRRLGVSNDLLAAGEGLSVALHRLGAELGHPAILQPSGLPHGSAMACIDVAGSALSAIAALMRNAPGLAVRMAEAPVGPPSGGPGGGGTKLRRVA